MLGFARNIVMFRVNGASGAVKSRKDKLRRRRFSVKFFDDAVLLNGALAADFFNFGRDSFLFKLPF